MLGSATIFPHRMHRMAFVPRVRLLTKNDLLPFLDVFFSEDLFGFRSEDDVPLRFATSLGVLAFWVNL